MRVLGCSVQGFRGQGFGVGRTFLWEVCFEANAGTLLVVVRFGVSGHGFITAGLRPDGGVLLTVQTPNSKRGTWLVDILGAGILSNWRPQALNSNAQSLPKP